MISSGIRLLNDERQRTSPRGIKYTHDTTPYSQECILRRGEGDMAGVMGWGGSQLVGRDLTGDPADGRYDASCQNGTSKVARGHDDRFFC